MSVSVVLRDERLRARIVRARALVDPRTEERAGAASGVVLRGGRLFVVQDDSLSALWIDPESLAMERVVLMGDGRRLPKREKADFEAVFEARDGALFVLGSGGTERRKSVVRYDAATGEARTIDATALHEALGARLPVPPNIEGAVLLSDGETVRLLHRGNGSSAPRGLTHHPRGGVTASVKGLSPGREERSPHDAWGPNHFFDVALASIEAGAGAILADGGCDLGTVMGANGGAVALTFTDATLLGGRVLYLAAAEDCEDAIADGPVVGAAIGVMEGGGGGRYALLTESDGSPSCRKIEGIALHPGGREAFVVTDPDDEGRASELCTVALEGPW